MKKNHKGKYFLAGVLGAVTGIIGGLLLAPQSGKKTRKDITELALKIGKQIESGAKETEARAKDVFGKASETTIAKYDEIKGAVVDKLVEFKKVGKTIDKEKYSTIVDGVVKEFKEDLSASKNGASKITKQLKGDWEKVKKAVT